MQMPVKTTLRLYCDDSRLVFKCMQRHQCIATQLPCYYSFVHKNVIVKLREICMETGSTSSATKVIARYARERGSPEANSGLSTSNLLLSYLLSIIFNHQGQPVNYIGSWPSYPGSHVRAFLGRQEVVDPSTRQFPGRAVVTAAILAVPRGTRGSGHYTGSHTRSQIVSILIPTPLE